MIRAQKHVSWRVILDPEDHRWLDETIEPERWYPMAAFERLGNAILQHNAGGSMDAVRMWGRFSAEPLRESNPTLVAPNDPIETLTRFRILRSTYFDFDALAIPLLIEDQAQVEICYGMGNPAEEAASHQTLGFFEGLLDAAGATDVQAKFVAMAWTGDPHTLLDLTWTPPKR